MRRIKEVRDCGLRPQTPTRGWPNKRGVWGLRPQRGPGAEPLAF